jgi:hypothetical protein
MLGVATLRALFFRAGLSAAALLLAINPAHAQDTAATGVVRGRVAGPDSSSIEDAVVDLVGLGRARTDSAGAFRFSGLPPGSFILQATKIGFRPSLKMIVVRPNYELTVPFTLERAAQELERVIVRTDSAVDLRTDPTGFDLRRRSGMGSYITNDEIEAKHFTDTEQAFRAIPGVEVDRAGHVGISRGEISINAVCAGAQVFVDGVAMGGSSVGISKTQSKAFSINEISLSSIRGIEVYRGPATTPVVLRGKETACGTVAIWTK